MIIKEVQFPKKTEVYYLPSDTRKGISFIRRCISWKFIF